MYLFRYKLLNNPYSFSILDYLCQPKCGNVNLIIDIGNTVAKVAVFKSDNTIAYKQFLCNKTLSGIEKICGKYHIDRGIVANVIDPTDEVMERLESLKIPILWLDHTTPLPIKILYKTPHTLGYDRVAGIVGAYMEHPENDILVVDAGTAVTYDFIDAKGQYYGGNISPGIKMRLKALNQFTARLPLVAPEGEVKKLGQTTEEAIRAGVIRGVEFEIIGYVNEMSLLHPNLLVFLTGGNDFSFDSNFKNSIFADRFLVIKGLNRILNYNKWEE